MKKTPATEINERNNPVPDVAREGREKIERVLLDMQESATDGAQGNLGRSVRVARQVFQELGISQDVGYDEGIRFCVGVIMEVARDQTFNDLPEVASILHGAVDLIGARRRR